MQLLSIGHESGNDLNAALEEVQGYPHSDYSLEQIEYPITVGHSRHSETEGVAGGSATGDPSGPECPSWCDIDLWEALESSQHSFMVHINADADDDIKIPSPNFKAAPRDALPRHEVEIYAIYDYFGADRKEYAQPEIDDGSAWQGDQPTLARSQAPAHRTSKLVTPPN